MSKSPQFPAREALEQFREKHPAIKSIHEIVLMSADEFVARFAADYFKCDEGLARQAHEEAVGIQEKAALLWANLKEAASPLLRQTLFNNIPPTFLKFLEAIPDYQRLFGSLDYLDCDHAESIFGPAAYFVDLLRFVDTHITSNSSNAIPDVLKLHQRRPDLAAIQLNKSNTNDLIPYIDLVIEILEALVRTRDTPDAYQVLSEAGYPFDLPFNAPLEEIRLYLGRLKTNLAEVYAAFEKSSQASADHFKPVREERELLGLSRTEYDLLTVPASDDDVIATRFGGPADLSNVKTFLQRTGLTRDELNTLVYQDLDRHEFNAGLSRLFFINNVDDGLGHLYILQDPLNPLDPSYDSETLVNLSTGKLDRIYRLVKLARKLDWSFADLDWVLRSFAAPYEPEASLHFDGLNDYVACEQVAKDVAGTSFTIEAWVYPDKHQVNPLLAKGTSAKQPDHAVHFIVWIDDEGRLAIYDKPSFTKNDALLKGKKGDALLKAKENLAYVRSEQVIPIGVYSHVAVAVDNGTVTFYINGLETPAANGVNKLSPEIIGTELEIGRDLNACTFAGLIKDVRLWNIARPAEEIFRDRYHRLAGRETNLVGYWPLAETHSGRLLDYTERNQHGIAGGSTLSTQPTWKQEDLVLDPLRQLRGVQFNGIDQFLARREITAFQTLDALTLEAWVQIGEAREHTIVTKGSEKSNQLQFLFGVNASGRLTFKSSSLSGGMQTSSGALQIGALHHVAATVGGGKLVFYIDGRPAGSNAIDASLRLTPRGDSLFVGRDFGGAHFKGHLSEVRIWSKSRTQGKIHELMHRSVPAATRKDLLGYWSLAASKATDDAGISRVVFDDLSSHDQALVSGGYVEDYAPTVTDALLLPGVIPPASRGTVLHFDGANDVLKVGAPGSGLFAHDRMTLAFWFNADDARYTVSDGTGRKQVLVMLGDEEAGLSIYLEAGALRVMAWCAEFGPINEHETVWKADGVGSASWRHVAVTYDQTSIDTHIGFQAFLDGVTMKLEHSSHSNVALADHQKGYPIELAGSAFIGGLDRSEGMCRFAGAFVEKMDVFHKHGFAGKITDMRLWHTIKTADEISLERFAASSDDAMLLQLSLDEGKGASFQAVTSDAACSPAPVTAVWQPRNMALITHEGDALENSYSHYSPAGAVKDALLWSDYTYTGRLLTTDADAGIGVTFYSKYPDKDDRMYVLRRFAGRSGIHLESLPFGLTTLDGTTQSADTDLEANRWYQFHIEVQSAGQARTSIRAKIWAEDEAEPAVFAIDASDESPNRLTAGTVGVWSFGPGEKRFDDLQIQQLASAGKEGAVRMLNESFESFIGDDQPGAWPGTSQVVRFGEAEHLFQTHVIKDNQALGTASRQFNVHAHYRPDDGSVDVSTWNAYEYSGRLRFGEEHSGIGVTFFSQFPHEDAYYRLRRVKEKKKFHLASHRSGRISEGEFTEVDMATAPNVWYRFKIQVFHVPDHPRQRGQTGATLIRVRMWEDGSPEPAAFQINAIDFSGPIQQGAVGFWTGDVGEKLIDDVRVVQLDPVAAIDNPQAATGMVLYASSFERDVEGQLPAGWVATAANNSMTPATDLFNIITFGQHVLALTEQSDVESRHTHYMPAVGETGFNVLNWRDYVYTGSMYVENDDSELGVTFYSRYPEQQDRYYCLRRTSTRPAFHLASHPEGMTALSGDFARAEVPTAPATWYHFRIQVKTVESGGPSPNTLIRARVWADGEQMPMEDQMVALDNSAQNISSGTVGVWANDNKQAFFDDLRVGQLYLDEQFDGHTVGSKPATWHDQGMDAAMIDPQHAYQVIEVGGQRAYGTIIEQEQTVSSTFLHPGIAGSLLSAYMYTGKMRMTDASGSIGVHFFSTFPDKADCYTLGVSNDDGGTFKLSVQPDSRRLSTGVPQEDKIHDSGIAALANTWYLFKIEVSHDPSDGHEGKTRIRARVWEEGAVEPDTFQMTGVDRSNPLASGTVGVWSAGPGEKQFDNLVVHQQAMLLDEGFEAVAAGEKPAGWVDTGSQNRFEPVDRLFQVAEFQDNAPAWRQINDLPLLRSRWLLKYDGVQRYMAGRNVPLDDAAGFTFEASVRPDQHQQNPIIGCGNSLLRRAGFWFGLNDAGQPVLVEVSGNLVISGQTAAVSLDRLTHLAVTINPDGIQFFVDDDALDTIPVLDAGALEKIWANLTRSAGIADLEIGRNVDDLHFTGLIQDVRVWRGARGLKQISASRYSASKRLVEEAGDALLAYWSTDEAVSMPPFVVQSNSASGLDRAMLAGGLQAARQPAQVSRPLVVEKGFWSPERLVLMSKGADNRIDRVLGDAGVLQRRTVEIWFNADDVNRSDRKQVLYHEGNGDSGLCIYLFAGHLYYGGFSGDSWGGSWIETHHVTSGRWHHAALVLDGRSTPRRHSMQAYLDGKPVEFARGKQLDSHLPAFGLAGTSHSIQCHDGASTDGVGQHFQGRIIGLRIWDTARTPEEIQLNRETVISDAGAPKVGKDDLVLWWHSENRFEQTDRPAEEVLLGWRLASALPEAEIDAAGLSKLSAATSLMERHRLTPERLAALWGTIKHTGRDDQRTLFDRVYNDVEIDGQPLKDRWTPYQPAMRWQVRGEGNRTRDLEIRSRLMGALRVSDEGLNHLVAAISGADAKTVVVDGAFLQQLYRLAQSARVLGLDATAFSRLLVLQGKQGIENISDFYDLSERAAWMKAAGIDLQELDFLVNDIQSSRVAFGFSDASVRDLIAKFRQHAPEFMASPDVFTSDEISQLASRVLVRCLGGPDAFDQSGAGSFVAVLPVLERNGIVKSTLFKNKVLEDLIADPAWIDLLNILAGEAAWEGVVDDALRASQSWLARVAAELETNIPWTSGLRNALINEGISREQALRMLQKLQHHQIITSQGKVIQDVLSTTDINKAFKAGDDLDSIDRVDEDMLAKIRAQLEKRRTLQQSVPGRLQQAGLINTAGVVINQDRGSMNDASLTALFEPEDAPGPDVVSGIRAVLEQRIVIQNQIGSTLLKLREHLDSTTRTELSEMFRADAERTQAVIDHLSVDTPVHAFISDLLMIQEGAALPVSLTGIPGVAGNDEAGYFYRLNKILILVDQFDMGAIEIAALLDDPQRFGLEGYGRVLKPAITDLESLYAYRTVRDGVDPGAAQLLSFLESNTTETQKELAIRISTLTGWDSQQVQTAIDHFGASTPYDEIAGLHRLKPVFDLVGLLGVDVNLLRDLSTSDGAGYEALRRKADGLLNVLRASVDEAEWVRRFKPIRDQLAVLKRNALLSKLMTDIPENLTRRRDPDLLYEFLLIDVQTGSEVDASRIQQAIASVQLYVQRCMMNLEQGVNPNAIPAKEWSWMKNYRVWEANRKVFLYPENYIEPELRDTKTPLFEELELELMQSNIDQVAVERVYINYLDRFRDVATLKIVGSYMHRETVGGDDEDTLYVIGRTNTEPWAYYYRERVQNKHGARWLPWKQIELTINAAFVTPVYAFGKLFLFWPEFTKVKKSVQRQLSDSVRAQSPINQSADVKDAPINKAFSDPVKKSDITKLKNEIKSLFDQQIIAYVLFPFGLIWAEELRKQIVAKRKELTQLTTLYSWEQSIKIAIRAEVTLEEMEKFNDLRWTFDKEHYFINDSSGNRVERSIDVFNTRMKYSYFNLSKQWVQPQTYVALDNELSPGQYRMPEWQRIYAQHTLELTQEKSTTLKPETDPQVMQLAPQSSLKASLPAFDMQTLTCSFWVHMYRSGPDKWPGWFFDFPQAVVDLLPKDANTPISDTVQTQIAELLIDVPPTPVDQASLTRIITLVDYDKGALQFDVKNVVDQISTWHSQPEEKIKKAIERLQLVVDDTLANNFDRAAQHAIDARNGINSGSFDRASDVISKAKAAESAANAAFKAMGVSQKADEALAAERNKANPSDTELVRLTRAAEAAEQQERRLIQEAKDAASLAHKHARMAQVIERLRLRWESTSLEIEATFKGANTSIKTQIPYQSWQHVALTLHQEGAAYRAVLYTIDALTGRATNKNQTISLALLPAQKNVILGQLASNVAEAFSGQLADFCIWNSVRTLTEIQGDRNQRKSGQDTGLFYQPLNTTPPVALDQLVPPITGLSFTLPPLQLVQRERIILMYGHEDTVKSIRNNLEDQRFDLMLEAQGNTKMYDVQLSRGASSLVNSPKATVHLTETAGLNFRDFTSGEPRSVALSPLNSASVVEESNYLMRNLEERESSLMDVNNQPGWYIIDTGDEQYLAKAVITKRGSTTPETLKTTQERLHVRYNDNAVKGEGEPQAIAIYFPPLTDDALRVSKTKSVKFEIERLNTFAVHALSQSLFQGGIDKLLLESQDTPEPRFTALYSPNPDLVDLTKGHLSETIDFEGVNRLYYEEIFFHIPFLIANQLNANQQFAEAQKWYHYIFNPTTQDGTNSKDRYWIYKPFRTLSSAAKTFASLLGDSAALSVYRSDPFDPHAIAQLRFFAYQKAVVMKYIDNLLDWGDALFSQDTRESIGEAIQTYVMAYNLLGPKPLPKKRKDLVQPGTFNDVKSRFASNGIPDFPTAFSAPSSAGSAVSTPHAFITTDFCIIENQQFLGYWDRVQDRLFKIRHSQNIEGIFRKLALFEPPIDPAQLVRAVAGGRSIGSALGDLNVAVPHYRYGYMLDRAKEMVSNTISLGSALLDVLEKRDAEGLALLQTRHEKAILDMVSDVKGYELDEAKLTIEALKTNKQSIESSKSRLDRLIEQDLSPEEIAQLVLIGAAQVSKSVAMIAKGVSAASYAIPDIIVGGAGIASPVSLALTGGKAAGEVSGAIAEIAEFVGDILDTAGNMTGIIGGYKRRRGGWEHERTLAIFELSEIEIQIEQSELRQEIAQRELDIQNKTVEHNQQVEYFFRSKYTNQALYNWMVARLSGLYFQSYRLAYDLAKSAEKALQYELPTTDSYISFGHWDSLKKGLLAGESLLLDLSRMEKSHLEQDSRFQEIERSISMKNELPVSFLELIAGGESEFTLDEALFDQDYPGHYFRVIKTVSISVVPAENANVDQSQSIRATLVQMGNKALLAPDVNAVRYLMGFDDADQPDGNTLRVNWRSNQQVAISKWREDSGMFGQFDLNFLFDDRYFPFEGTGAVSTWKLEMPPASNPGIDLTKIADVVIHLRYTSKYDSGAFKQSVQGLLEELRAE